MSEPSILHIDIDAFFASVETLLNPSLRGKPVIVGGLKGERGVVASASYEARKFGIRAGTPLKEAERLCPSCIFLRGHYPHYKEISDRFFSILSRFTPQVERASLDEAYLNLSSCSLLYPSFIEISKKIKETVEGELQLSVSLGLAPNKLLAKLATSKAKPGGFYVIGDKDVESFLENLEVKELPGVGPVTLKVLEKLNIKTVGELKILPLDVLKKLFGLYGEALYFMARGMDYSQVITQQIPKSISRETTFHRDIADFNLLIAHLAYLSDRLSLALRRDKLFAGTVELKVRFSDFRTLIKHRKIEETNDPSIIYKTLKNLFVPIYENSTLAIRLLGVGAKNLTKGKSNSLFESPLKREYFLKALDSVREKFGFSAVLTGREITLRKLYPLDREHGYVLKTSSLTK
jgi:DNA polymerase-4